MASLYQKFAGGLTALALCASSTGAVAATTTARGSISPLVALSALGSDASRTALCGSSASSAIGAVGVAAAQAAPAPGCVLPVTDPAPIPVAEAAPPVVEPAYAAAPVAKGLPTALLIGLPAALVGLGLIALLTNDDDDDDGEPISPN